MLHKNSHQVSGVAGLESYIKTSINDLGLKNSDAEFLKVAESVLINFIRKTSPASRKKHANPKRKCISMKDHFKTPIVSAVITSCCLLIPDAGEFKIADKEKFGNISEICRDIKKQMVNSG